MKLPASLICVAWALISYSHASSRLALLNALGLEASPILYILPFVAATACFFLLTIRLTKEGKEPLVQFVKRNRLFERLIAVSILLSAAWIGTSLYCKNRVAEVLVPHRNLEAIDWPGFQASLGFKAVRVSDSSGERICFERGLGRTEKVEALLLKIHNSDAKDNKGVNRTDK
jgi:hypothetical protein